MVLLEGVDLGDIQRENQVKTSGLFILPIPGHDSDEVVLLDLFGNSTTITIEGRFVGTNAQLRTFVSAIEALQSGTQTTSTYEGGLLAGSIDVLIQEFSWDYMQGQVRDLKYVLTLVRGGFEEE